MNGENPIVPTRQNHFKRFISWFKKHRKVSIIVGGLLLLLTAGGTTYAILNLNKPKLATIEPATTETITPKVLPVYYSPLTGSKLASEAATKQAVTAIMIENSPDARPQSGLKDSGVVFEAIAEGGITRFLVLYQEQKPQLIGPVRSVRLYYVDWLAPFNASVAHVGGSKFALDEVRNGNYRDIDQFFNSRAYWRATDRYAPHNVYTSFENLDELNQAKGYTSSEFTGFTRKNDTPAATPNATSINVTISGPLYNSTYSYDSTTNSYLRSQGGEAHLDRESGQINPRSVVVMKATMSIVMEDGYRESITTTGTGQAYIFQDGTVQEVTWQKDSRAAQLTFKNAAGEAVSLNRGQTWITVVPSTTGGASWQ